MQKKVGFTLIELAFSIAFISILSIAVILVITDTVSSYSRGLTLNQVNNAGTDLVDDMMAAVQNSSVWLTEEECSNFYNEIGSEDIKKTCIEDGAQKFVVVTGKGRVDVGGRSIGEDIPLFGAFCTGRYSYVWNSGYFFNQDEYMVKSKMARLSYSLSSNDLIEKKTIDNFKLLKVRDEKRMVCKSAINSNYNNVDNEFNIASSGEVLPEAPIELLANENNLALYDLEVDKPALGANNRAMLYSVSFILGTLRGGINIVSVGDNCATPGGYNSAVENFDFCSINKFNFATQAIGG